MLIVASVVFTEQYAKLGQNITGAFVEMMLIKSGADMYYIHAMMLPCQWTMGQENNMWKIRI